jgi:hypothetical protein
MNEPRLPAICDVKLDFNKPAERGAAFAWLHHIAPVLTSAERQQVRRYLKAVLRDERGEFVIMLRGRKLGGQSRGTTSSRAGVGGWLSWLANVGIPPQPLPAH